MIFKTFADQDLIRAEKFYSPLISARLVKMTESDR